MNNAKHRVKMNLVINKDNIKCFPDFFASSDNIQPLNEIVKNLYVGGINNGVNNKIIKKYEIQTLYNVSFSYFEIDKMSNLEYFNFEFSDNPDNINGVLINKLIDVTKLIKKDIDNEKKVSVVCSMGINRSITVIAIYLILFENKRNINELLDFICKKRKIASPNFSYLYIMELIIKNLDDVIYLNNDKSINEQIKILQDRISIL